MVSTGLTRLGQATGDREGKYDQRDHIKGYDSNDLEQTEIVKDLVRRLGLSMDLTEAVAKLRQSRLMDITEYGRAVHAEMDALLTCARNGTSPVGSTLFTTTFPCHVCTRHIVAAGVKKVVYIEPYPKSMASKLHKDSIEMTESILLMTMKIRRRYRLSLSLA